MFITQFNLVGGYECLGELAVFIFRIEMKTEVETFFETYVTNYQTLRLQRLIHVCWDR
jgi:hypothetical protein